MISPKLAKHGLHQEALQITYLLMTDVLETIVDWISY